jgi:hypothetical protein
MAAKEEELSDLHSLVANVLKQQLKITDDMGKVSPQILSNAIKFLKDNGIEAAGEYSKELQELSEDFPFDNVVNFK